MFNKSVCVLFSGRAGVGKSTCAHYLAKKDNKLSCTVVSFAHGIKIIARNIMGWNGQKDDKGRRLLQDLGKVGRDFDENVWVKFALETSLYQLDAYPFDLVLVDDWRFPNEYFYIKTMPLYNVYRVRIYAPDREVLRGTDTYNDISEVALSDDPTDYDYVINNSGSILNLNKQLDFILSDIKKKNTYGGIKYEYV